MFSRGRPYCRSDQWPNESDPRGARRPPSLPNRLDGPRLASSMPPPESLQPGHTQKQRLAYIIKVWAPQTWRKNPTVGPRRNPCTYPPFTDQRHVPETDAMESPRSNRDRREAVSIAVSRRPLSRATLALSITPARRSASCWPCHQKSNRTARKKSQG